MLIFLVIAVVVLAAVAGGVVLAGRSRKEFKDANVVVPGRPTPAPGSWAGSHDPEARLHRRLRDAMTALRANQSFDDDGGLLDLRVDLEQQALALDERLVAVAALPEASKGQALFDIESAVAMVESAVASLATRSVGEVRPQVERAVDRVDERTSMLEQVRAQLEALPATTPPAPPLRIVRDETAQVQSRPPAATPEPTSSPSPPRPPAASPAEPPPASRPPAAPQGPRQPPRPPRPGPTGGA